MVQLLLAHLPRQLHHLPADPEGHEQHRGFDREYLDEDRCLRRRHDHRLPLTMGRPQTRHVRRRFDLGMSDPSLGPPQPIRRSRSFRFHAAVLRSRSLGRKSTHFDKRRQHDHHANGFVQVIPIHLNELSPPAFRSTFPGRKSNTAYLSSETLAKLTFRKTVTYQLGNMISSPSAQIVNAIAESISISGAGGPSVPAYGPTMGMWLPSPPRLTPKA